MLRLQIHILLLRVFESVFVDFIDFGIIKKILRENLAESGGLLKDCHII